MFKKFLNYYLDFISLSRESISDESESESKEKYFLFYLNCCLFYFYLYCLFFLFIVFCLFLFIFIFYSDL